jgi:hypothetical protein
LESYVKFNVRYEKHVCEKALDGTVSICGNNISLLKSYCTGLERLMAQTTTVGLIKALETDWKTCNILITALTSAKKIAKIYKTSWEPWNDKPRKLWHILERTWEIIERLTKQTSLLDPQLEALKRTAGFIK